MADAMTFELTGQKELVKALRAAGRRAIISLTRSLVIEAEAIMRLSKLEVDVDEGTLRNSGFVKRPRKTRTGVEITMGYGGAAQGYAVYLHEGTGPAVGRPRFFPPIEPFQDWARRVLGDESLAFVVARSVGMKGLKPRKFLENPLKLRSRGMARRMARRVRRDVERGGRRR